MSLYRKYRPQSFDEVVGNEETVKALRGQLSKDPVPHAFALVGPTGCGKTTLARIIARELGADGEDFREIDSADFRGIDTIREIRRQIHFKPLAGGKARVWLLDEAHALPTVSQEALLKGLEDPPDHVYFILATTNLQKLLPTIRGRCSIHQVRPLKEVETIRLLRPIVKAEGESLTREIYEQIAEVSKGHPRDALQLLSQVLAVPPDQRREAAEAGLIEESAVLDLCQALLTSSGWKKISVILQGLRDEDPEKIRRAVLGYCTTVLLKGENDRAGLVMEEFREPLYDIGWPGVVLACYSIVRGE